MHTADKCVAAFRDNISGQLEVMRVRAPNIEVVILLAILANSSMLRAQDVSRTHLNVGDHWTYERTDHTKRNSKEVLVQSVVGIVGAEYRLITKSQATGNVTEIALNEDLNQTETGGRRWTPHIPLFSWPLVVGKKWEVKYSGPNLSGSGEFREERSCEVLAKEFVNVAAGNFETVKVACHGKFTNPSSSRRWVMSGYTEITFWYSPAAGRPVKYSFRDGTFDYSVWYNFTDELVTFGRGVAK